MAGRYRVMRSVGDSLGSRRYLLPSLIALTTGHWLAHRLQAELSVLRTHLIRVGGHLPRQGIGYFGVPAKASKVLGMPLSCSTSIRAPVKLPYLESTALSPSPVGQDFCRTPGSVRSNGSTLEVERLKDPISKWSPWSASSVSASRPSFDPAFKSSAIPASHSRRTLHSIHADLNEIESILRKLRHQEAEAERLLRAVATWIWLDRGCIDNMDSNAISILEREIDKCRQALIREGFLGGIC
ncbi:MAG: hypothetical protein MMC23_001215 [Stictis urceolatum]|nr:hypothetical protein [Stictis urceolata]